MIVVVKAPITETYVIANNGRVLARLTRDEADELRHRLAETVTPTPSTGRTPAQVRMRAEPPPMLTHRRRP